MPSTILSTGEVTRQLEQAPCARLQPPHEAAIGTCVCSVSME
jgi:hypothetical protein